MAHTLIAYVEDKPGVLNRVASLFRRRAFNIVSLTVGRTEQAGVSRMTIVVDTDEPGARRAEANLYKLVNVLRVDDVTNKPAVVRELVLVKVGVTAEQRTAVLQLVNVFRARVVDISAEAMITEITGSQDKVESFIETMRAFHIISVARTGLIAMVRGGSKISANPPLVAAQLPENGAAEDTSELSMSV